VLAAATAAVTVLAQTAPSCCRSVQGAKTKRFCSIS
jgi:hypothetical protein